MADANPFENVPFSETRGCVRLFNYCRDETRTVSFSHPKDECSICYDITGLKMKCGHFICPDDILNWAWQQVARMKYVIPCAYTDCEKIISTEDLIKFGLPNNKEKLFLTTAITTNFYESQDINQCPQCQTLCSRKDNSTAQVHCTICKKNGKKFMFCWYCLGEWKTSGNLQECGNEGCRKKEIEILVNSPMKRSFFSKGVTFPETRACPNIRCSTLVAHKKDCPIMICERCQTKFCFVCLTMARDGSMACRRVSNAGKTACTLAPPQTKLR